VNGPGSVKRSYQSGSNRRCNLRDIEDVIEPKHKYTEPLPLVPDIDVNSSHTKLLALVGDGKRVVEFGCATGYVSRAMSARGCRVLGIESDPQSAEVARRHCDDVIVADLDMRPLVDILPATTFDVATFGDVLEHLRDPERVLGEVRSFLRPGGFVVISIPNVAHGANRLALLQGRWDYARTGLLDDTHLRFFTAKTVRELCMRSGFRIVEMHSVKAPLFGDAIVPAVDPDSVGPDLIRAIEADPEHDTIQFVLKAVPVPDEDRLIVASESLAQADQALRDAEARLAHEAERARGIEERLEASDRARRQLAADLEEARTERIVAKERAEAARADALNLRAELETARAATRAANEALDRLRGALEDARGKLGAELQLRTRAEGRIKELEAESEGLALQQTALLEQKQRELDELTHASQRAIEAVRTFVTGEVARTRAQMAEVDQMIGDIQASKWWSIKLLLARLSGR